MLSAGYLLQRSKGRAELEEMKRNTYTIPIARILRTDERAAWVAETRLNGF